MGSKIRDYKGEVIHELESLKEILSTTNIESDFNEKYNQARSILNRIEPSLMFYGVYNAGKSSLLNAIFGEEKASVADIPETHKITPYNWRNFCLVDTPGVNGPEEDFMISKPELQKHNVIMFVIDDSDNFDSDFVAKEIVGIIDSGKPLIIVLNNKQNSDKERFNTIRSKLCENISKAAKSKSISNITQKYEFIVVNSNMAYKGKTENKNLLIKASNIEQLEIMISEQLRKIDEIKILMNPLGIIMNSIKSLLNILSAKIEQSDDRYFSSLLQEINEGKNSHVANLQALIRMEIRRYSEVLYSSVTKGNEIDTIQEELTNKLGEYINNTIKEFCEECNTEFNFLINRPELKLILNNCNNEAKFEAAATISVKNIGDTKEDNVLENALTSLIAMKIPPAIIPLPTPIPIPAPIIVAIVKGIISLFKKDSGKNQDIEDLQEQIDNANAKQREATIQRINAMQEARTQINIQLHKLEEETIATAIKNINDIYNKASENLKDLMEKANKEINGLSLVYSEINKIESNLLIIKGEIS